MFIELTATLEERIQKGKKQMEHLLTDIQRTDQQVQGLYTELGVTPQQLTALLEDKKQFDEKTWEELQRQKEHIESRLQRELAQLQRSKKKKGKEHIQAHWQLVR